jgi:N6-L-threonylcarbamoyladenine synthase
MRIFAIETSCDETAMALVDISGNASKPKIKIIKEEVASQINLHAKFGGVVPNLAKREHIKNLPILFKEIFNIDFESIDSLKNNKLLESIDLIAVTVGPGLEPALWAGINFSKELSRKIKKPLFGANHLEGHLYSFFLSPKVKRIKKIFPAVSLIISGGHTILAYLKNSLEYKKLGETLDDAVGESFDKVARLLNLSYPGGPEIERLAKKGDENSIPFPSPMINQKNYNFSYSGLKTAVLYYLKSLGATAKNFSLTDNQKKILNEIENQENIKANIAASFQKAAFEPLVKKSVMAAKSFSANSILIGGGVAANKNIIQRISKKLKEEGLKINVLVPPIKYCMDNATMIALAAFMNLKKKKKYSLVAKGNLNL